MSKRWGGVGGGGKKSNGASPREAPMPRKAAWTCSGEQWAAAAVVPGFWTGSAYLVQAVDLLRGVNGFVASSTRRVHGRTPLLPPSASLVTEEEPTTRDTDRTSGRGGVREVPISRAAFSDSWTRHYSSWLTRQRKHAAGHVPAEALHLRGDGASKACRNHPRTADDPLSARA